MSERRMWQEIDVAINDVKKQQEKRALANHYY